MQKGLIKKGAVSLFLTAGFMLTTGTKARADVIDPVRFYFMDGEQESPIIEIGTPLKELVPSFDTDKLRYVDNEEIRKNAKRYITYSSRTAGATEWGNEVKRIDLTDRDQIEVGKDYKIHFTFKTTNTTDSLANPFDKKNCVYVYEDASVPVVYAGHEDTNDNTKAKTVELELFTCNQGSKEFDMTQNNGRLVLSPNASDAWLRQQARVQALSISGTLNKAVKNGKITAKVEGGVTTYDLDKDGADDLKYFENNSGAWEFVVQSTNSVTGTWSYTVPAADRDSGISALLTYYETLRLKFQDPDPIDIKTAKIAAIPDQTYTGAALTPAVTVTLDGVNLKNGIDYIVSYEKNTNEGTASVTVTGQGTYTGSVKANFVIKKPAQQQQSGDNSSGKTGKEQSVKEKIVLPKAVIKSCKPKAGKKIALKWKKIKAAGGYEIAYSTNKSFKKAVKTKKTNKTSITLKSLKKGKTYYVRVRAYVKKKGEINRGKWSVAKKVKVKK